WGLYSARFLHAVVLRARGRVPARDLLHASALPVVSAAAEHRGQPALHQQERHRVPRALGSGLLSHRPLARARRAPRPALRLPADREGLLDFTIVYIIIVL